MYGRVNIYDYDKYRNPHCVHCLNGQNPKRDKCFNLFVFFVLFFCLTQYNPRISKDLVKYLTIKVCDKNYKTWHDVFRTSLSSENKIMK